MSPCRRKKSKLQDVAKVVVSDDERLGGRRAKKVSAGGTKLRRNVEER